LAATTAGRWSSAWASMVPASAPQGRPAHEEKAASFCRQTKAVVLPCLPRLRVAVWGAARQRYGDDAIGRAARVGAACLCARGAWREGSREGRRCGDGRAHHARVGECAPRHLGPGGSHGNTPGLAPTSLSTVQSAGC
jgi:hypothetical protein